MKAEICTNLSFKEIGDFEFPVCSITREDTDCLGQEQFCPIPESYSPMSKLIIELLGRDDE